MRFSTWNVRSLFRAGSLAAAARELRRYELELVGVEEARWEKGSTVRAGDYNIFYAKRKRKSIVNRMFCTPHSTISSLLAVGFMYGCSEVDGVILF